MKKRFVFGIVLLAAFGIGVGCRRADHCTIPIGITNFKIEPSSAAFPGLNSVGGYQYLTGGHRGVVVVRTGLDNFVAYERSCPMDTTIAVEVSEEWGSTILECPVCHSLFSVYSEGAPMDGSQTPCALYKYSTNYDGGTLWVY